MSEAETVDPAGNQQQQPLQSVHVAVVLSGPHVQAEPSLPPVAASWPADPLELDEEEEPEPDDDVVPELPELPEPDEEAVPELDADVVPELDVDIMAPELVEPPLSSPPPEDPPELDVDWPASFEPPPLLLLEQAARPTVVDEPATTRT